MKTSLHMPVGAVITVTTKDGRTLKNDQIKAIDIEPFFSTANGQAELAHGEVVTDGGDVVDKFTLYASGTNGKVTRRDRVEKGVVPLIDRKKSAPPKEGK